MFGDQAAASGAQVAGSNDGLNPKGYYRIAMALAVLALLLVVFQYGAHGVARRAGLLATAEPLTELYFSHPTALPKVLGSNKRLDVTFVIVNQEGSRRAYDWSAEFIDGTAKVSLAKGSIGMGNLESHQIALDLPLQNIAGTGIVEVSLASPKQSIDFHLSVVQSGKGHVQVNVHTS